MHGGLNCTGNSSFSTICGPDPCPGITKTDLFHKLSNNGLDRLKDFIYAFPTRLLSVNCTYTVWGEWNSCSKTCGGGYKARTRFVSEEPMHNGTCLESMTDIDSCNTELCQGKVLPRKFPLKILLIPLFICQNLTEAAHGPQI